MDLKSGGCERNSRPVALELVVKGKFLALFQVLSGEDPDSRVTAHDPLLCLAVRGTGVVNKPREATFLRGINHL